MFSSSSHCKHIIAPNYGWTSAQMTRWLITIRIRIIKTCRYAKGYSRTSNILCWNKVRDDKSNCCWSMRHVLCWTITCRPWREWYWIIIMCSAINIDRHCLRGDKGQWICKGCLHLERIRGKSLRISYHFELSCARLSARCFIHF